MSKFEENILRKEALAAVTEHDSTTSPVLSTTQFVDGLVWLRKEILAAIAPMSTVKDFESKSALCRMFQTSMYTVDKVIRASRIGYRKRSNGQYIYNVADFKTAFKANSL